MNHALNTEKGFAFVTILIFSLILAVIGFGAYFLLNLPKVIPNKQTNAIPNNTSKAVLASPKPTPDFTANWQTYTAEDGTYQVKFPPDGLWGIYQDKNNQPSQVLISCNYIDCAQDYSSAFSFTETKYITVANFLAQNPKIKEHRPVNYLGMQGEEALVKVDSDPKLNLNPYDYQIFIPTKSLGYIIEFNTISGQTDLADRSLTNPHTNLFPDIPSTFKLLTPPQNPPSTHTFADAQYGFTFDYPANYYIHLMNSVIIVLSNGADSFDLSLDTPDSNDNDSQFLNFASQRAMSYCRADGPTGYTDCDKVTRQETLNDNGLLGYKFYLHFYEMNNGQNTKDEEIGPVLAYDVAEKTQNKLKSIVISHIPYAKSKTFDPSVMDLVGKSLRFPK